MSMSRILTRVALGGVGLAAVGLTWSYYNRARKSDYLSGETVGLKCSCGKVTGTLHMPHPTSNASPGVHMCCFCKDCTRWGKDVVKHGGISKDGGDEVFFVYKPCVRFNNPELIASTRLYNKTNTHRYETTCCRTAVAVGIGSGLPVTMLSSAMVRPDENLEHVRTRFGKQYNVNMKSKKHEPKFEKDPLAVESISMEMVGKTVKMLLTGMWEMNSGPSPLSEDFSKERVIYPNETR